MEGEYINYHYPETESVPVDSWNMIVDGKEMNVDESDKNCFDIYGFSKK